MDHRHHFEILFLGNTNTNTEDDATQPAKTVWWRITPSTGTKQRLRSLYSGHRVKRESSGHKRVPVNVGLPRSFRCVQFPRLTPPTFYQPWSLLRKALIRAGKTSHTAGTLCDIRNETVLEIKYLTIVSLLFKIIYRK
jgi:hypothetical protein